MSFEHLVAATGSTPRRLALLDCLSGVHYVRTSRDAQALRDDLAQARRVAVIGGGFIGAEVALSARKIGLTVTIVEAAERLMSRVLPPGSSRHTNTT